MVPRRFRLSFPSGIRTLSVGTAVAKCLGHTVFPEVPMQSSALTILRVFLSTFFFFLLAGCLEVQDNPAAIATFKANDGAVATIEGEPVPVELVAETSGSQSIQYVIQVPPAHGILTGTAPLLVYTPANAFSGKDFFTFSAKSGSSSAQGSITITVTAVAPTPQSQTLTLNENGTLTVTLSGTDVANTPMTYAITSPPLHGTLSGTIPNLVYTPVTGFFGTDSFKFSVNDGTTTSTDQGIIAITVNQVLPPVPKVLALITDINSPLNVTLTATDPQSFPVTYEITQTPTHGVLSGSGSALVYTPNSGYLGSDSFSYTATNGFVPSAAVTASIQVNPLPTAGNASFEVIRNTTLTGSLASEVSGGGVLTYSIVQNGSLGVASFTNGSTGAFQYVPNSGSVGPDQFSFQVSDGIAQSNTATVALTVNYCDQNLAFGGIHYIPSPIVNDAAAGILSKNPYGPIVVSNHMLGGASPLDSLISGYNCDGTLLPVNGNLSGFTFGNSIFNLTLGPDLMLHIAGAGATGRLTNALGYDTTYGLKSFNANINANGGYYVPTGSFFADESLLFVGEDDSQAIRRLYLGKLTSAGVADTTFGTAGFQYVNPFPGQSMIYFAESNNVAQPQVFGNNQSLIGGIATDSTGTQYSYFLAQYTSGGAFDNSFNQTGFLTGNTSSLVPGLSGILAGFAMQRDAAGNVYAATTASPGSASCGGANCVPLMANYITVIKVNAAGQLNASFGTKGIATAKLMLPSVSQVLDMALDSQGRAVVLINNFQANQASLLRFTAQGVLDLSFGSSGMVSLNFDNEQMYPRTVMALSNSKIRVAGAAPIPDNPLGFVIQFTLTGSVD